MERWSKQTNRLNDTENYNNLLQKWFLFREIDLLDNNSTRYDFLKTLI